MMKKKVQRLHNQKQKQVSTVNHQTPQQTENTAEQGQVLHQNQFFERNHFSGIRVK